MIKERKVLKKINMRNRKYYMSIGYDIKDLKFGETTDVYIKVGDLTNSSKDKITGVCKICGSENTLTYSKYRENYNRNNKGYYSCFKCKNVEKEKTCMKKYGVKSYSMTDEFKETESLRNDGKMRGIEKGRETMLKKYGFYSYSKTNELKELNRKWMSSDEFVNKSKKTMLDKYGVDHYSKTDEFRRHMSSTNVVSEMVGNMKKTNFNRYNKEYYSQTEMWMKLFNSKLPETLEKIKKTCLDRYGVSNVSQVREVYDKILKTKIQRNIITDIKELDDWSSYKRLVSKYTRRNKPTLLENWNGYDYYDNEYIKENFDLYKGHHKNYPTIDHKISVLYGFLNGISEEEISGISNLCITKRYINSSKTYYTEEEFLDRI